MMGNILFSNAYFLRLDPKQWETGLPYPPLGTLYAAAVMRHEGYNVSVFDAMFCKDPGEIKDTLDTVRPGFFVLYDDGFNYLTKMCLTNMRQAAFRMISLAKACGSTVIVSSSDATDHYEMYLERGADFVLLGEAEVTLSEVVRAAGSDADVMEIPGLTFLRNGAVVKTRHRNVMKDLDALPFPAWDLIDIEPYRRSWLKHAGYFSLNMTTTRGCPYKCNWCAKPIYGNRYNSRSPRNVVEELLWLKQKYHFDHIWFCDDIFGLKPGWVEEFAALVQQHQLSFQFKIQARADLLNRESYVEALALAGCTNAWMGAESGSQKILDAMDKGITVDQVHEATRLLRKHRIHPSFFIQFGYPGETKDDIAKTIAMINELLPYEIGISVSYPLPGTVFYEKVKAELLMKSNWTDSDELALMFRNTYQPAFYKQLHRYVHRSYRKHLALENVHALLRGSGSLNYHMLKKALSFLYYTPAAFLAARKLRHLEKMPA